MESSWKLYTRKFRIDMRKAGTFSCYTISFIFSVADKKLFTPGPLSCSRTVKKAMQRDLGSRDIDFIQAVKDVRSELLKVAGG